MLRGSSSKWRGSQYISTTASLECAVKFAAPFNPIVKIDVARFLADGSNVVDLRDTNAFAALVPPAEDEDGSRERAAVLERAQIASDLLKRMKVRQTPELQLRERDANLLYTQAAHSPWECARLFSTRSNEISLAEHVPGDCVELLSATVVTTGISVLPYG